MAAEPISIFSIKINVSGVAQLVRRLNPDARIAGTDDAWTAIVITGKKSWFGKSTALTINHDPDYYAGKDWPMQRQGTQNYFSRFPEVERKKAILRTIGAFRFSLGILAEPLIDLDSPDWRAELLLQIAQLLDGYLFTPSSLRDAQGRVLIDAAGNSDPEAHLREITPVLAEVDISASDPTDAGIDEEAEGYVPPTAERVARRAMVLAAVTARALLEQEDPTEPSIEERRDMLLDWINQLGIGDELEPDEWKVLQRRCGTLDQQSLIDATWRFEGLAVLAWALNLIDLPPHDELIVPDEVLPAVGFLDLEESRQILNQPQLREPAELETMNSRLLGIHWRLRDFSIRPEPCDFVEFSKNSWFGGFDVRGVRTMGSDLAIGEHAIAEAPDDDVQRTASAAMERHLASNWLLGFAEVYSETPTDT